MPLFTSRRLACLLALAALLPLGCGPAPAPAPEAAAEPAGPTAPLRRWEVSLPAPVDAPPAVGPDGTVYVAAARRGEDRAAFLRAYTPDGEEAWTFRAPLEAVQPPVAARQGRVYLAGHEMIENGLRSRLYALGPGGRVLWQQEFRQVILAKPALAADLTLYLGIEGIATDANPRDGRLVAIDPEGRQRWVYATGAASCRSLAVGEDGTVYAVADEPRAAGAPAVSVLHAVSPDGEERWRRPLQEYLVSPPALAPDGTIYLGGDYGSLLYAFAADGSPRWTFGVLRGGERGLNSPVVGADGSVYLASNRAVLYAVSAEGARRWEARGGSSTLAAPLLTKEGRVYWTENRLAESLPLRQRWDVTAPVSRATLRAATTAGEELWRLEVDGVIRGLALHGGQLYLTVRSGEGGRLLAYPLPEAPAHDGWPQAYGNAANTASRPRR
jgi:outer membrane protein assembly factor BamB